MTTSATIARLAAAQSARIRNLPVSLWRGEIEAQPEGLRECLREYLAQVWRARQHKARADAEKGGPVAQTEIQKLREALR